jgi:type II secretory pathway pseudopilin PulG
MNIKKDKFKYLPGFTVLELLIVIAMMVLLMGMVLMGLNNSRSHARDQGRISDIKKIQIGITQYYQVCGNYPVTLDANAACTNLSSQGKSLKDFLPDIDSFGFTSGNTGKYKYVPITYVSGAMENMSK